MVRVNTEFNGKAALLVILGLAISAVAGYMLATHNDRVAAKHPELLTCGFRKFSVPAGMLSEDLKQQCQQVSDLLKATHGDRQIFNCTFDRADITIPMNIPVAKVQESTALCESFRAKELQGYNDLVLRGGQSKSNPDLWRGNVAEYSREERLLATDQAERDRQQQGIDAQRALVQAVKAAGGGGFLE